MTGISRGSVSHAGKMCFAEALSRRVVHDGTGAARPSTAIVEMLIMICR